MGGGSEHKLPGIWNREMDFFICDCDARDVDPRVMMKTLKRLFPELRRHAVQLSSFSLCLSFVLPLERLELPFSPELLTH